ncbi:MAG: hypothetical protein EHM57_07570 [Actinobacteria bacterium]|nr:MAG: hypothetical protein EHM57_07570 [Actinomycetota bacterium]
MAGVTEYLARAMAERADGVDALVAVPRAPLRRWRTGVDPARELAIAVGRLLAIPVIDALAAPMWWPRHAGRPQSMREPIAFRSRRAVTGVVAIVDDVVTTGTTLHSAAAALSVPPALALVATSAGRVQVG